MPLWKQDQAVQDSKTQAGIWKGGVLKSYLAHRPPSLNKTKTGGRVRTTSQSWGKNKLADDLRFKSPRQPARCKPSGELMSNSDTEEQQEAVLNERWPLMGIPFLCTTPQIDAPAFKLDPNICVPLQMMPSDQRRPPAGLLRERWNLTPQFSSAPASGQTQEITNQSCPRKLSVAAATL